MSNVEALLDLSAVFDTIDHRALLNYLSSWFSLSGVVLDWFASYLADINQCVKVGDALSDPADLIYGVPQGSLLGPILFLYTTPLNKILFTFKTVNYHFYTDNCQLYILLIPTNFATAIATL